MSEPTPISNRLMLEQLRGRMDTFEATVTGQMNVQTKNVEQMNVTTASIDASVTKLSNYCSKLFDKQEGHERDIAATKVKVKGHEELCEERDRRIENKLTTGFTTLRDSFINALTAKDDKDAAVATAEEKAEGKKDANKKWRTATFISILALVLTLIALVT